MTFTPEDAVEFLSEAREEYDGEIDYSRRIAEVLDPDDPDTHKVVYELSYSAH